ncbi:Ca-transporting ATPase [Gloeophyllum trabeum ATCC 11539]|uniref:Calcium-transporting ATPase 1 n=1 Tax=Gloeophyllum trabeum (strain ATCC 11539 / FP-39264 / Madison 617) TaxID=670483 RepID=S7Q7G7_GLOTA|nr:Ca-transporting ATPase [Gloeophyllum trabeum ATCC 11539]EPQ55398.1 Ca-transporting ATPase [Gloeophyllum trabeum ATCC 11539]
MGYERRKSPARDLGNGFPMSSSSSYGLSHVSLSGRSQTMLPYAQRSPSPPASAYFTSIPPDHGHEPEPSPGAAEHFAYSTTLRRHHTEPFGPSASGSLPTLGSLGSVVSQEGPSGLWNRAVSFVKSRLGGQENDLENGNGYANGLRKEPHEETPSARFAHISAEDTISHFHTSPTEGLPSSHIPALREEYGYNEFSVSAPEPAYIKFAKTIYESPLILLLCGSAFISAIMGNIDDAVSITVAVLIVLTVGFVQERRSEKSLEALNKLVPHHCHLIRDGHSLTVLANELVPGDIVTFTTGDRIPADVRLISAVDLEIDESSLTGETTSRRKDAETCVSGGMGGPAALADRTCIAYMGTLVRNGRGSGTVIATGKDTEFGVIFSMMEDVEERRTPLQLKMDELAKNLSILSFGIIGLICIIGVLQQRSWLEMFTIGVSLAVAAIPEGLPIVTTVTLALGVLRMSNRKAIVKKLHSVEALGSVSVICSDKTGTLTKNEQTVTELYTVDEAVHIDPATRVHSAHQVSAAVKKALEIGALCNNASASRNEEGVFVGQSTDVALLNILSSFNLDDPRKNFTRLSERPFNSEVKYMAVSGIHSGYSGPTINGSPLEFYYIKGSIDAILDRCKFYYVSDGSTPGLDSTTKAMILQKAQATASRGLRVIALAYGYGSVDAQTEMASSNSLASVASRAGTPESEKAKTNLVFVGFQAMFDPPRKGVSDAISLLQQAGVQVVMITGDAEQTALAIAKDLGLLVGRAMHGRAGSISGSGSLSAVAGSGSYCLTGQMIDRMSKGQLKEMVGGVSVFARTTPRHKMAIVEAFQARGAVVAMTGDGVNDAPALKMADIGVSMGKSGTDVAKEAADMILVDDNFTTILPAVEEGKSIFHNIQNFLAFQLSTAAAALSMITLSTMFGLSNPLNAMQILFINILMDGPPSQSLGVDPVDPIVMRRPPRRKDEPIISRRLMYRVLFSASMIVIGTLYVYAYALSDDHMSKREQTMTFTSFVFLDLVSALQNRGLACSLTANRMLLTTVSISFLSQLALVYVPFMQSIFQTEALGAGDMTTLLCLAGLSFGLHEARRRWERKLDREMGGWAGEMA